MIVTSRRYRDTAVTASLCSMPQRVIGRYERSCPTIVMSVPWSVVTTFRRDPFPSRISRARIAEIACGSA